MNRLENIQTFIHVVERGSFSSAAEHLDIAKSMISKRIKVLEEDLGAQLLHRTTRKLHLTQVGEVYYHRCLQILNDLDEADHLVGEHQTELKGRVRVAAPLSFATMHLMPLFNQFLAQNPQIQMELDLNDREIDVIAEGFDLAIRIGELSDSTLIAKSLTRIRLIAVASPDYLKQNGNPQSIDALHKHHFLIYNNIPTGQFWPYEQGKARIKTRLYSNSGDALLKAAVDSIGIAITPTFLCQKEIEAGLLQPVLKEYPIPSVKAYAVYPSRRYQPIRIRKLVELLQHNLAP